MPEAPFSPIEDILADLRAGKMVILTDDESRENEGDLVLPSQFVTPEAITFMLSVGARVHVRVHDRGGLRSARAAPAERDQHLAPRDGVHRQPRRAPQARLHDGRVGGGAGEVHRDDDRREYGPEDFARPGHINPLRSRDGGVLVRTGQTEGSVDLCRLAGLYPSAVIIEIMRDDGEMARVPDLDPPREQHGIKMCSVAQIIEHRLSRQSLVQTGPPSAGTEIRDARGDVQPDRVRERGRPVAAPGADGRRVGRLDGNGEVVDEPEPTLVRMHKRNVLGDIFGELGSASDGGSTGSQLRASMEAIQEEGRGAIVYLRPEGLDGDVRGQPEPDPAPGARERRRTRRT
jgi:3,4-dihydroxy 2-butanone 4-phosphate synthase/GTP cyclohydrolase II